MVRNIARLALALAGCAAACAAGCAIDAPALDARSPVNPSAPIGRLAGAPAELRPGGVVYSDVPRGSAAAPPMPMQMPMHHSMSGSGS